MVDELLERARSRGIKLFVEDRSIRLRGPADAIAELRPALVAHREELYAVLCELALPKPGKIIERIERDLKRLPQAS